MTTTANPNTKARDPKYVTPVEAHEEVKNRDYGQLADALYTAKIRCLHCASNWDREVWDEVARILRKLHRP